MRVHDVHVRAGREQEAHDLDVSDSCSCVKRGEPDAVERRRVDVGSTSEQELHGRRMTIPSSSAKTLVFFYPMIHVRARSHKPTKRGYISARGGSVQPMIKLHGW
jgi:hypothetical protein